MNASAGNLAILRNLESQDIVLVVLVLAAAWLLASALRWLLRHAAERAPMRLRLPVQRTIPLLRLCIGIGALAVLVPILVEPSFHKIVAIVAIVSLALAFVLKDYAAGLVMVLEALYQPGDWIEMDGTYGEVRLIGLRAVHVVTALGKEVVIPHSRLWSASISNATSGSHSVLCVADFYLDPNHDAQRACECLVEVGENSAYRKPETKVNVVVQEKPWGTHYELKVYVNENREQFNFVTDLTIRGKEALRASDIRLAQAPYLKAGKV